MLLIISTRKFHYLYVLAKYSGIYLRKKFVLIKNVFNSLYKYIWMYLDVIAHHVASMNIVTNPEENRAILHFDKPFMF